MSGDIAHIITPVALIVLAGYLAVRLRAFPREGVRFVMGYAQNFAVPLLLFDAMRKLEITREFRADLLASYFIPAFICFALGIMLARARGRGPLSAGVLGFCAYFGNTLLLGLPLSERAFGTASLTTNYVMLALHSPLGYLAGALVMAMGRGVGLKGRSLAAQTLHDLVRNPLIIGISLGLIVNIFDIPLAAVIEDAIELQSRAALPAALFGLGAVLTGLKLGGSVVLILGVSFVSLIIQPVLVLMAAMLFALDAGAAKTLIFVAAMPVGTNGYIFASLYEREEECAASTVFFSTLCSLVSLPIWLILLAHIYGG